MNKFTKKSLSLLLSSSMILGAIPSTFATEVVEGLHSISSLEQIETQTLASSEADFTFKEGEITKYTGTDTVVIIPSTIGGEVVTSIGASTFAKNTTILTVTIPEGITKISKSAFSGCSNLLSVTIPSTVDTLEEYAFYECKKLTTITLPNKIQALGNYAFNGCSGLLSIHLPSNLISIGSSTFTNCSNLTNVVLPSSLVSIGSQAFRNCDSISSIEIPANVVSMESSVFQYCDSLTEVQLNEGLLSLGNSVFSTCAMLTNITLPETLMTIGTGLFYGCTQLKSMVIPSQITTIPEDTFNGCSNLTFVKIPNAVTGLGKNAFRACNSLEFLYIPSSVTSIGTGMFYSGSYTTSIIASLNLQTVAGSYAESYAIEQNIPYLTVQEGYNPTEYVDPNNRVYQNLTKATQYSSYLTKILDVTSDSTLVSGSLPSGLGIFADGTIGGVPTEEGTFEFVVNTTMGEMPYSITVQANTAANVEADNDFDIIERIPTIDSNENDHVFEVSGEYNDFLNVYLDGKLLVRDVDYTGEEGSTVLVIAGQTFAQLGTGSHTINATFAPTSTTVTPSTSTGTSTSASGSSSVTVEKVAQTFEKTVAASTTIGAMPFTDVAVSDWHYQYVRYMYDTGTFSGVTDTTYEPNTGMTRAMMAVVFYGMADKPSTGSANFSDVVDGEWYADAVNWISTSGIDDSVGTFRPTEMITREETAKMMHNFCTDQGIYIPITTSRTPNDMDTVSENAKNAVNVLFSKGIFAGDNWDNFNPHNTSTRAEISAMMRTFMWATV